MASKPRGKLIKKLDTLFSLYIRKRDGKCIYCNREDTLQCAHIVPRTFLNVRWKPDNAIALCYKHHIFWAHKDPIEFVDFINSEFPGRIDQLRIERDQYTKYDISKLEEEISKMTMLLGKIS